MNGEGGEIQDLYGRYPLWRGQQVASGRFGVTSEMVNSSYLVEIKIGQGAKPGEGGHLPARKVTAKVAQARNATAGTDLISPSNNHDLYSIEDLAELIDELKTANPDLRVSVKVPVVPNIGTIGVGHRQGGRGHHHAVRLRGRHRRGALARAAARRAAFGHRHARRAPGADGGGAAQPGRDLGRRRLPARPRHREAALPGREPGRASARSRWCRSAARSAAAASSTPATSASRRRSSPRQEAQLKGLKKFTPQAVRVGGRELRALLRGDGRGGRADRRVARLRRARRTWSAARTCSCRRASRERVDLHELIRPLEADARPGAARPARCRRRARGRRAGGGAPAATGVGRPASACSGPRGAGALARERIRAARSAARSGAHRGIASASAGPGAGCLRRRGRRHHDRGRRPGRRREDDVRRQGRGDEGRQPARAAPERLGRQVVRVRRPARAAVRAGRRRLALLHPPVRRRRGGRRRAARAARRLARLPGRPRQPQGLRVRVHDGRARGGARRPRARGSAPARPAGASTCASTPSGTSTAPRSSAAAARARRSALAELDAGGRARRARAARRLRRRAARHRTGRPRPTACSRWRPSPPGTS